MRKLLLITLGLGTFSMVKSQDCADLFISEYVEAPGNNKGLEIYNPTSSPVDLINYRIIRWDNGSVPPGGGLDITDVDATKVYEFTVSTMLAAKDVYVLVLNITDPAEMGGVSDTNLTVKGDASIPTCNTSTTTPRTICFNGDDAVELQKKVDTNWVTLDIFGCIGERPVNVNGAYSPTGAWTNVAPFSAPPPGFQGWYPDLYWTQDKTLIRKASVLHGVTTNPAPNSFNPSVQWDSLPEATYTQLGSHICDCLTFSNEEQVKNTQLIIYPNPASEGITIQTITGIVQVKIYNLAGGVVMNQKYSGENKQVSLAVAELTSGIYLSEILLDNGQKITRKFIRN